MTQNSFLINFYRLLRFWAVNSMGLRRYGVTTNKGFTLVELILVVVVIGILATVSIPAYNTYVNSAKTNRAMGEIRVLNSEIMAYSSENGGALPVSLDAINRAGLLDPWRRPYVYYNFAATAPPLPAAQAPLKDIINLDQLNSDFDLYSLGPNNTTAVIGGIAATDDDIVRFNDGTYVDLR